MSRALPFAILVCFLLACSSGEETTAPVIGPPDGSPSTVTDLHIAAATDQSLTLAWTAPGVAASTIALAAYDLRRIPLGQESQDWDDWQSVQTAPPAIPGTAEQTTIDGLVEGSTWVFRLRSLSNNAWSSISVPVVASVHPQWDQTPPAAIADLEIRWRSETDLMVTWGATGGIQEQSRKVAGGI